MRSTVKNRPVAACRALQKRTFANFAERAKTGSFADYRIVLKLP